MIRLSEGGLTGVNNSIYSFLCKHFSWKINLEAKFSHTHKSGAFICDSGSS